MFKYETVVLMGKDPNFLAKSIIEETKKRPEARLAHQTPIIAPDVWQSAAKTAALILTFETWIED